MVDLNDPNVRGEVYSPEAEDGRYDWRSQVAAWVWFLGIMAMVGALLAFCAPVKAQTAAAPTCVTLIDAISSFYGDDPVAGALYDTVDAVSITKVLKMAPWKNPQGINGEIPLPDSMAILTDLADGRADFFLYDKAGCAFLHLGPIPRDLASLIVQQADAPPPFSGGPIEKVQPPKGPSI